MNQLGSMLLRWLIPNHRYRACIIGDLTQLYASHRSKHGWFRATAWYWSELLHLIARFWLDKLVRRPNRRSLPGLPSDAQTHRTTFMENFSRDVTFALRTLRGSPGFVLTTALTVALGIAATTTVFSVANAVLLKAPDGVRETSRLVTVHRVASDGSGFHSFGYLAFEDYRNRDSGLEELTAFFTVPLSLSRSGDPSLVLGLVASANYFRTLGTRAALGRLFTSDERGVDTPHLVAVLSHSTWTSRFAADPDIVGQTVTINRRTFTVIGVAEPGFAGHATLMDGGIFLPLSAAQEVTGRIDFEDRGWISLELIGRLKANVTLEQASLAMNLIAQQLGEEHPTVHRDEAVELLAYTPMIAAAARPATAFMGLLLATSAVILLISCVNVGGMLLSRASSRGKEMALRLALGAPRRRLIRQLLTESVLLFAIGGALGIVTTVFTTRLLNAFQLPIDVPFVFNFSPDGRVLSFALGIALVTGVAFGLAPALFATKQDLNTTLKEDNAATVRSRLRNAFVVAQVAGSALLLVSAGLFVKGLHRAGSMDLGMNPNNVHTTLMNLEIHNYGPDEARIFYENLLSRVEAQPFSSAVGMTDTPPLSMGNQTTVFFIEGRAPEMDVGRFQTDFATVTPGYFNVVEIPMLDGRTFTTNDQHGAPGVVIINEAVANRVWPGERAVGKRMRFGSFNDSTASDVEVVGVVRTGKYRSIGEADRFMVYRAFAQSPDLRMAVMVRVEGDMVSVPQRMRETINGLDPALPLEVNTRYTDLMGVALFPNRAAAFLAAMFGVLGLILASVGLYGVLAFSVTQRHREIGIRLALGARGREVLMLILQQGGKLAAWGLVIGFAAAAGVGRLIRGFLFGVSPSDPWTYLVVGACLMVVALGAALYPAIRATDTDPVHILK